jgi:hypothetical protein
MRSATGIADEQCELSSEMCGLRGGRELTTAQVARKAGTGRRGLSNWMEEVPAKVSYYRGGRLCAEHRVIRAIASAWCWMKERATKSWRRDLQMLVSSLFLGLTSKTTISPHGAFSTGRVPVGRGQ